MEAIVKTQADLDDVGGILTEEWKEGTPTYNFRALMAYCNKVGKNPEELTDLEREQFRTN